MTNREGDIRRDNYIDRKDDWREDCRYKVKDKLIESNNNVKNIIENDNRLNKNRENLTLNKYRNFELNYREKNKENVKKNQYLQSDFSRERQ